MYIPRREHVGGSAVTNEEVRHHNSVTLGSNDVGA